VAVVLKLLGKRIGEPGKATHGHPHGEILALGKRRVDVLRIGRAFDDFGWVPMQRSGLYRPGPGGTSFAKISINMAVVGI